MSLLFERFSPPLLNAYVVKRKRIVEEMDRLANRGILFIHSPAGYGKTTAATLWSRKKNVAWLSIDDYSATATEIYRWLLFSLSSEVTDELTSVTLQYMLDALQTIKKWPDALIIDDFHLCKDISVAHSLLLIRSRMPTQTAFIILSRNPPPDVLTDQLLNGKIKQMSNLKFTKEEIVSLFNKNKKAISNYDAELLCAQTDGWPAALSAILISNKDHLSGTLNNNTLNNYLKSHVFEYSDSFDALKKCSILETFSPSLCNAITEQDYTWEVVNALAKQTGLVQKLSENACCFHSLLKEFLFLELQYDDNIDKTKLYIIAANWYKDHGDTIRSLDMAAKSGDINTMEEISHRKEYGNLGIDFNKYVKFVEEDLLSIPKRVIEQYPSLSLSCAHGVFLFRPIEEVHLWFDILEYHMEAENFHRDDCTAAALLLSLDTRYSSWHVPKQFKRIQSILKDDTVIETKALSLTELLPYFHKAQRDYTDISQELPTFIKEIAMQMKRILGGFFSPLSLLIEAGIYYECGQIDKAEAIAEDVVRITRNFPPEIIFCALALYYEILRVQGKQIELERIAVMIEHTNATYLSNNFNAYSTVIMLYNSDIEAATSWLEQSHPETVLKFYKVYQYFTCVRAMIVLDKLSDAEKLLQRLIAFSVEFRRTSDLIEALTLQSICMWHMKRADDAVQTLITAIIKASELQLVMPIIKEGNDVLPILQKILNRLKYGYDTDRLNKSFVNSLFFGARNMLKHTRGMLAKRKDKPIKLSPRQKEVLILLQQKLSYREISCNLGVKITTIDDHISKLYEKLEVSNAQDAVIKAGALGLLDVL